MIATGHEAKEIVPGLILGSLRELPAILDRKPDVLFPLDRLPGSVWETGFRGEIVYYPITDYDILPTDVLEKLVEAVLDLLRKGKRVGLFCVGGHGRTGYVAACILFQLGIENPIAFLRLNYSASAVENAKQEQAVERFCLRHVAVTYWDCKQRMWIVQVKNVQGVQNDPIVQQAVEKIQRELGEHARILLRPSGVLPEISVLVEAPNLLQCEKAMNTYLTILKESGHIDDPSVREVRSV